MINNIKNWFEKLYKIDKLSGGLLRNREKGREEGRTREEDREREWERKQIADIKKKKLSILFKIL